MHTNIPGKKMGCIVVGDLNKGCYPTNIFCKIGQVLTSSLNPEEVFKRVMVVIGEHFSPRNWSLLLMEKKTGKMKFEIVMGIDAKKLENIYLEKGEGIAGWVAIHGKPQVVPDVKKDHRFSPRIDQIVGFETRSVVCVPLLNGKNQVVGVIELINKIIDDDSSGNPGSINDNGVFTEDDMELLASIGVFTGIAAENAFLYEKVRELAMIDPLTGVYNRHYFNEMFSREEERVRRYNYPICILMMDVDGLKHINDTYGHLEGDKALKTIADILKSSCREADLLARFGGDEFVLLMPHAREKEGREVANRIQKLISKWNAKSMKSSPALSLSIGIHAADATTLDNLLIKADQELYQYKTFKKDPSGLTSEEEMRNFLWENLTHSKNDES